MGDGALGSRRPWLRWSLGLMMVAVAGLACVFAAVRRNTPEAVAIRLGTAVLQMYEPGFKPDEHRADKIAKIGAYWQVHFTRITGVGKASTEATVNDWTVQEECRQFWQGRGKRPMFPTIGGSGQLTASPAQTVGEIRQEMTAKGVKSGL